MYHFVHSEAQGDSHSLPSKDNAPSHKTTCFHHTHTPFTQKSKLKIVTPNPASEFPSGEGTKNDPTSDCSFFGDPKCLDTSLNFFFINFCNIHCLKI
ncbi:hypothetical protein E2C01_095121 [Portunus trituberculatus]|uniref:Uncharacterized protein n=1 Tax=Portunus trituberculatus TaxID=210409 RepID=A0A5B7JZ62_PORTR|nr:hypothetical protein [Portunus trituberculatus]